MGRGQISRALSRNRKLATMLIILIYYVSVKDLRMRTCTSQAPECNLHNFISAQNSVNFTFWLRRPFFRCGCLLSCIRIYIDDVVLGSDVRTTAADSCAVPRYTHNM